MAEWTIATVCKTVALTGYPGSNPGLSTKFQENQSMDPVSRYRFISSRLNFSFSS